MFAPRARYRLMSILAVALLAATCHAQPYLLGTVAGGGLPPTPATAINVSIGFSPQGVAVDASGNVYFTASNCVFKVDTSGTLTRLAGTSSLPGYSGDGGPAGSAQFSYPQGIAADTAGNLYIADTGNHRIRKIAAGGGTVSTVAGYAGPGFSGDTSLAAGAELNRPTAVAVDSAGNLYIADSFNQRVRKVTAATGFIATIAGNGIPGFSGDGGPATAAQLTGPTGVAVDSSGNVYIAEVGNSRVRKVASNGIITTAAGNGAYGFSGDGGPATAAQLNAPAGLATDSSGNLYIADTGNSAIRKVANGTITTVAGPTTFTNALTADPPYGDGGLATKAVLGSPSAVALDSHANLFIADTVLARIRGVTAATGIITTIAGGGNLRYTGDGGPATSAQISLISGFGSGVTVDNSGNLYFADGGLIRKVAAGTGIISTVASGNGPVTGFDLYYAVGLAVDAAGDVYIADVYNNAVRKVAAGSSAVTTYAGNGLKGFSGDGGPAVNAEFDLVAGVALDSAGNLYIADMANGRIRKVAAATGIVTTVAGNGLCCYAGDGGPATAAALNQPNAMAVDNAGNLYIADNQTIRKVAASTGIITTVAGNGTPGYSGDGGPATSAQLMIPESVAVDATGNLYVLSATNSGTNWAVRKVTAATGIIATIAGGTTNPGLESPAGVAVGRNGQVYVADHGNNVVYEINDSGTPVNESFTGHLTFNMHVQNVQGPPQGPSPTAPTVSPGNPLAIGGTVQFTQSLDADPAFPGSNFFVQTSVPPQWTITGCSSDNSGGCAPAAGNLIALVYPSFPTGQTPTYTLTADGPAASFLAINSTASTGAAVSQIVNVLPSAAPLLSFQPATPTAVPGLQLEYDVAITNTGGAKLVGDPLTVTITPDPSVTLLGAVSPGEGGTWDCVVQSPKLICIDSAALPAGGSTSFDVTAGVSSLATGSVTSSATLTFGGQAAAPVSASAGIVTAAPQPVTPIAPAPGATLVPANSSLSWTSSAFADTYTVFFGTTTPPPAVATITGTTYTPLMAPGTTYYWSVAATNAVGSTPSPVWSFTTNPCEFTVSPASISLSAQGTSTQEACPARFEQTPTECGILPEVPITFTVTPTATCGPWTATSSNPIALQILSGASGTGGGTVSVVLLNNTHISAQNLSITVGNSATSATYSVSQAGSDDFENYREVYALYEQILGRDPDPGGLVYWSGASGAPAASGANSLGIMADDFIISPEAFNSGFAVMAAYQAATGNPPTYSQFVSATAAVRAGRQTIAGLFNSLTAPGVNDTTLYQNLLNRQPGVADANCVAASLAQCFQTIVGYPAPSPASQVQAFNNEFQSTGNYHTTLAADHTNALYVRMLYYVILGRDPDPAGFNFWLGVANGGGPGVLFVVYQTDYSSSQVRLLLLGTGLSTGEGFTGSPEFQGLFVN